MFHDLDLRETHTSASPVARGVRAFVILVSLCASVLFVGVLLVSEKASPGLAVEAAKNLSVSGVENPVTAVLLNYRSYDTLLEIAVLLVVVASVLPLPASTQTRRKPWLINRRADRLLPASEPILIGLVQWLVPFAILLGAFLLWVGAYSPGGAFQAGAVIAGAGVALLLAGYHRFDWTLPVSRYLLIVGLSVFTLVAGLCVFLTGRVLEFPPSFAAYLILFIESAATLSIAATLLCLFCSLVDPEFTSSSTRPNA